MKRLLILAFVVFVLAGCRGQSPPATDPFLGRTRVPPPGTGSLATGPADPYYQGAPSAMAPPMSSGMASPPSVSTGAPIYSNAPNSPGVPASQSPAGDVIYRGSHVPAIRIPSDPLPVPKRSSPTLAAVPATAGHPVHREPPIRIVPPERRSATNWPAKEGRGNVTFASTTSVPSDAATTGAEPRRLNVPTRAVNIKDLPKPNTSNTSDGFRLVSAEGVQGDSAVVPAALTSSSPRANYSHADDYSWLRGRLEYSQVGNRWKLRYIPVNGKTDQYGGSVHLADSKLLTGCERGDFVQIHGRVGQQDPKRGFAPNYEMAKVKRLD